MTKCCALDCNNKGIHTFSKNPEQRKAWEKALRIRNFKATDHSRLCSVHFKSDDYVGQSKYYNHAPLAKFLKKTAVPSRFSFHTPKTDTLLAKERQARLEKRSQKKLLFEEKESPSTSSAAASFQTNTGLEMDIEKEVEIKECEVIPDPTEAHSTIAEHTVTVGTQVDMENMYGSIRRYKNDDFAIKFYTGFECYKKIYFVYSTLSPMAHKIKYFGSSVINLSTEDQFFLTMMKLRQNKCNFELSRFFNISHTTVSNIFTTWVNYMYQLWSLLEIWPTKKLVQYYMPEHFKNYNINVRVILDGTEFNVQKPKHPTAQQASWSSYKHANTLKVLVGATPGGLISHCSPAYAGSISDRQTIERSDLMKKCERGDCILADRGFNIQDMFSEYDVTVNIRTFLKGKTQLPGLTVLKDRTLASKRVHIERLIGLTKTYKILKGELDHSYIPIASKNFLNCVMCCNFRECIMKK